MLDVNINAVIYKGRHNYICQTRLENLFNNHTYLLNTDEYEAFITLLVWEWETLTGDINECNGFQMHRFKRLWSLVRCEKGFCSSNNHFYSVRGSLCYFFNTKCKKIYLQVIN